MADEKLNTGQEQTEQPSLFDAGPEVPAPEEKPKGRRGRKPKKEKTEPAAPKGTGPRRGRPPLS